MNKSVKYSAHLNRLLVEAARRYCRFNTDNKPLTEAWTGLGTPAQYRPAYEAGLMKPLDVRMQPRINIWWVLTEKGAAVVDTMIKRFALERIENRM